jgi:molybdopterin-guanine dinucleotide biosynthesis protein A
MQPATGARPTAIVLAGGRPDPRLAPGLPSKAFLAIGGRPLVSRAIEALRGCAAIQRVLIVGPVEALEALLGSGYEIVPEQASLMDNIGAAAARLEHGGLVLTVASDLPLITAEALTGFLDRCQDGADFYYPIVPQAAVERRFPTARKTYVTVTDGTFCGGSVLLFDSAIVDRIRPFVEQVISARKKPWLLAQLFGWPTVMKFASRRLSIAEMEARAHQVTGIRGRTVVLDGPELALDVDADRPENLHAILAEFGAA